MKILLAVILSAAVPLGVQILIPVWELGADGWSIFTDEDDFTDETPHIQAAIGGEERFSAVGLYCDLEEKQLYSQIVFPEAQFRPNSSAQVRWRIGKATVQSATWTVRERVDIAFTSGNDAVALANAVLSAPSEDILYYEVTGFQSETRKGQAVLAGATEAASKVLAHCRDSERP